MIKTLFLDSHGCLTMEGDRVFPGKQTQYRGNRDKDLINANRYGIFCNPYDRIDIQPYGNILGERLDIADVWIGDSMTRPFPGCVVDGAVVIDSSTHIEYNHQDNQKQNQYQGELNQFLPAFESLKPGLHGTIISVACERVIEADGNQPNMNSNG
jgi:hypothetical protein